MLHCEVLEVVCVVYRVGVNMALEQGCCFFFVKSKSHFFLLINECQHYKSEINPKRQMPDLVPAGCGTASPVSASSFNLLSE